MFGIVRILIGIVLGVIASLYILRFAKIQFKRKLLVTTYISVILLITLLGFVPFENLVYTFKSPQEAYNYYHSSKVSVDLVVEGEQSDLVVAREKGTTELFIVPKTEKGWKLGSGLNIKRISQKVFEGIIVTVYQYKSTNDCFISVFDVDDGITKISDNYNTEFYALETEDYFKGNTREHYYAYVSDFNSQYSIVVNGNKLVINQGMDL